MGNTPYVFLFACLQVPQDERLWPCSGLISLQQVVGGGGAGAQWKCAAVEETVEKRILTPPLMSGEIPGKILSLLGPQLPHL